MPPEVLRQVKLLELRTRGLVNSLFTGEYRSVFKGQGMEFAEVREYQPGDEVRSIDWNVTARMQRPFVKRYIEERELTVMLAVDVSGSERFGTRRRFKSEVASELAAVLAMSAIRNNDRVGCLMFTDRIEHVVPPRKGRRHALRLIRDMLAFEPQGRGTDIAGATEYLNKMLAHKAIIFLVSDFLGDDIERPLKLLAQRHDVVAVTVEDPSETALPDIGLVRARRSGDGRDARRRHERSRRCARSSTARSTDEADERRHLLRRLAIDEIPVTTEQRHHGAAAAVLPRARDGGCANERVVARVRSALLALGAALGRDAPARSSDSGEGRRHGDAGHRARSAIRSASRSAFARRAARRSSFRARLDSTGAVQSLDPVVGAHERRHDRGRAVRATIASPRGTSAAADPARRRHRPLDGVERRIPLSGATVFVQSVLPADTAQRVPKPPRAAVRVQSVPVVAVGAHRGGDHRARAADLVVVAAPAEADAGRRRRSVHARRGGVRAHRGARAARGGRARALRRAR